jgi:hypothetical protein
MFGWFRPTCPCDPAAKRWVEERLRWLTRQFGLHILLERPIILPTDALPAAIRVLELAQSHVESQEVESQPD